MSKPAHYRGSYHVQARRVRQAAYANPQTTCWRCGLTLTERRDLTGKQIRWTAGHLVDGQPGGELRPEHSDCNYREGGKLRHTKRTDLSW